MKDIKVALVGLGNVGRHVVELYGNKRAELRDRYGLNLRLVGVIELKGSVVGQDELDPAALLALPRGVDGILSHPDVQVGLSGPEAIHAAGADVIIESTPTNLETGEPGLTHLRTALQAGTHVVTLAKGPLVVDWPGLNALARAGGAQLRFSGAAAAALPTIDVARYCLAGTKITCIRGILNGTTNYILTRMHAAGIDYQAGLKEAQQQGIAEPDPTLDVEGYDTAAKITILANAVLEAGVTLADVSIEGITGVTPEEVRRVLSAGKVVKLVGSAVRNDDGTVQVQVGPVELEQAHPLAQVNETNKAIYFDTAEMGPLMVTGGRSDPRGAAAAALKDIVNLAREL